MPTTLEVYFGDRILLTWDHQCDGTCSYNVSYSSDCRSQGSGITNETRFEIDFADCNELEITLSVAAIDTICGLTSDTATINMSLPPRNGKSVELGRLDVWGFLLLFLQQEETPVRGYHIGKAMQKSMHTDKHAPCAKATVHTTYPTNMELKLYSISP